MRLSCIDFCKLFQWKTELYLMEKSPYDDVLILYLFSCLLVFPLVIIGSEMYLKFNVVVTAVGKLNVR